MGTSDTEIRELASKILERPEYAAWRAANPFVEGFLWLSTLFETNPALFWILGAVAVLLLLLIVAHVTWTIRVGLKSRTATVPEKRSAAGPRFVDEARALAERGRFLDAARALQLGTIDLLIHRGHVQLGRGDANAVFRQRLRESALDGVVRDELVALVGRLERSWFRDRNEDEELYRCWERAYTVLDARAGAV